MSCRFITPVGKPHQEHMGRSVAPGVFADDEHPDSPAGQIRLCTHPDPDGLLPPSAVTFLPHAASTVKFADEQPAVETRPKNEGRRKRVKKGAE